MRSQHLTSIWNNWRHCAFTRLLLKVIWITKRPQLIAITEFSVIIVFLTLVILRVVFPNTALRDHRIELVRASWQELTITISDVSLSDEGQYTCSLFTMPVKTTKAFLTVLGEHVHFGPLSTDQLLVADSSCSHSMNTCIFWMHVCYFSWPHPSCFVRKERFCITFLSRITVKFAC